MKTTTEQRLYFERLVARAEQEISQQPEQYKRRLQNLVYLGYAVILGLLASLVLLAGGTIWLALSSSALLLLLLKTKLIVVLLVVLWVLVRSIFIKLPRPQGYALERDRYPRLWTEVDQLSKTLSTPPIHQILLNAQMNAALIQTPRFGLLGPTENTLIIGLELLLALSTQQARSVLAHELAHLSGNHSKFAGKIYRLRQNWFTIHQAFIQANAWGTEIIRHFFAWYAPYFAGYSYALARNNEYEADYIASRLTSREAAASALVAVNVLGELTQQQFWTPLFTRPYSQSQPESQIYTLLQQFYQQTEGNTEEFKRYLHKALQRQTEINDTHPALMERLKALKLAHLPASHSDATHTTHEAKAITWLEPELATVFKHFNRQWVDTYGAHWDDLHERSKLARETVNQLKMRLYEELSTHERWQLAQLTDEYLIEQDALPLYQHYAQAHPEHLQADLAIGRLLLERGDSSGIAYLEQAMREPSLQLAAAETAWRFYSKQQQTEHSKQWLIQLEAATDRLNAARQERAELPTTADLIEPSPESLSQLKPLVASLAKHKNVHALWLAEKQVAYFPNYPVYVVAVKIRGFVLNREKLQAKLLNELDSPIDLFLINSLAHKKLFKQASTVGRRLD